MMTSEAALSKRAMKVLIVDDDENDVLLIQGALERSDWEFSVHTEHSGDDALSSLRRLPDPTDAIEVVLLDLRMPGKNGHETLREIRSDSWHASLPVIVLTTSDQPSDMETAFQNGAQCFVTKPATIAEYDRLVDQVLSFWNRVHGERRGDG